VHLPDGCFAGGCLAGSEFNVRHIKFAARSDTIGSFATAVYQSTVHGGAVSCDVHAGHSSPANDCLPATKAAQITRASSRAPDAFIVLEWASHWRLLGKDEPKQPAQNSSARSCG
jgi:hypothetical protein